MFVSLCHGVSVCLTVSLSLCHCTAVSLCLCHYDTVLLCLCVCHYATASRVTVPLCLCNCATVSLFLRVPGDRMNAEVFRRVILRQTVKFQTRVPPPPLPLRVGEHETQLAVEN